MFAGTARATMSTQQASAVTTATFILDESLRGDRLGHTCPIVVLAIIIARGLVLVMHNLRPIVDIAQTSIVVPRVPSAKAVGPALGVALCLDSRSRVGRRFMGQ